MSELARVDQAGVEVYVPVPAKPDTDSWIQVVTNVAALAERIADTPFVPKGLRGSVPATAAAMLYGREVGLPPMTALTQTHVVEGRPSVSAEAMRAMVFAGGHEIAFAESTGAVCRIRGKRRGQAEWTEVVWTIDMARAAGLVGKDNWKHYPRRMLQARATSELCEMIFPDVIHGFRSVEEMEDAGDGLEPTPTSTVQRAPAKAAVAAPRKRAGALPASQPAAASVAPVGRPPLPGEPGYPTAGVVRPQTASAPGEGAAPTAGPAGPAASSPTTSSGGGAADQLQGTSTPPPEAAPADRPTDEADPVPPRALTAAQRRMLFARLTELGIDTKAEIRLRAVSRILRRQVDSFNHLTMHEGKGLIDTLARFNDRAGLVAFLDALEDAGADPVTGEIVDEPAPSEAPAEEPAVEEAVAVEDPPPDLDYGPTDPTDEQE